MAKREKDIKTNAMRILDKAGIPYSVVTYECDEFTSGSDIADKLGQDHNCSFKTIVAKGKSGEYSVFVIPVDDEIDLKKAAVAAGEKSVETIHVKDINAVTGYIRGGCSPIGMKKNFKTVIHSTAQNYDTVIISGGRIGSQIHLSPLDLIKITNAKLSDIKR